MRMFERRDYIYHGNNYKFQGYNSKYRDGCTNDFARFFYDKLVIPEWNNRPVFGFYHVQDPETMSRITAYNHDKDYLCYVYTNTGVWNKKEEEEVLLSSNVGIDITFIYNSLPVDRSSEDTDKNKYDWLERYIAEKCLPFPPSIVHGYTPPTIVIIDFNYKEDAIAFFKYHWSDDKYSADDANRIRDYIEKNFDENGMNIRKENIE